MKQTRQGKEREQKNRIGGPRRSGRGNGVSGIIGRKEPNGHEDTAEPSTDAQLEEKREKRKRTCEIKARNLPLSVLDSVAARREQGSNSSVVVCRLRRSRETRGWHGNGKHVWGLRDVARQRVSESLLEISTGVLFSLYGVQPE